MTQMVSAERAGGLALQVLELDENRRLGSGSASERTSQSRQLMSPAGTFETCPPILKMSVRRGRPEAAVARSNRRD